MIRQSERKSDCQGDLEVRMLRFGKSKLPGKKLIALAAAVLGVFRLEGWMPPTKVQRLGQWTQRMQYSGSDWSVLRCLQEVLERVGRRGDVPKTSWQC
jgi:hypothetical protein